MELLKAGVPLTLLIDLATPPNSAEILAVEGQPSGDPGLIPA